MSNSHSWLIGRDPRCDIVLTATEVSSRHCRLTRTLQGWSLEDLESTNGTFVNGTRVLGAAILVSPGDRITLGARTTFPWPPDPLPVPAPLPSSRRPPPPVTPPAATPAPVPAPAAPVAPPSPLGKGPPNVPRAPTAVNFKGKSMVLGRHPTCEVVLDYPMVSTRHARLTRHASTIVLEDLGSTNGTFVNGTRISRTTTIHPGDVIGLGSYLFTFTDDGALQKRDVRGTAALQARGLGIAVRDRTLIRDIDLTIYPGEFVGLMGPSGAGKTTLLNALNGYTPPTDGQVLLSGQDLYRHYDQFRCMLGYVPQDDVMHRDLTVGEALYYSARLRLPSDYTRADIEQRIRVVLAQLGLAGTEKVPIGSAEKKGISGGQRRRVNLAMELLTDPAVLFLDEPTSGLSSEDALTVMKVLRQLADDGKTILLTIHQPGIEVYRLLDHLVLLGKDVGSPDPGRLVYFGPAYPDAVNHFNPRGIPGLKPGTDPAPDEVLRGLGKDRTTNWIDHYRGSKYHTEFIRDRAVPAEKDSGGSSARQVRRLSPWTQWLILIQRCLTIKICDRMNTAILLAQAPIVAVLLVMVFGKELRGEVGHENWREVGNSLGITLFLTALAALWFGASNAVREIVGEWAIYHRERMVSLRIGPYVFSKLTILGGLALIQCLTLIAIVGPGCALEANWGALFGVLFLAALVGTSIGLVLSALARTSEVAIALLPIVLLPMVIMGGAIQPMHKMPGVPQAISQGIPMRWAFEGLLLQEAKKRPVFVAPPPPPIPPGTKPPPEPDVKPDMAERFFRKDEERTSVAAALGVLGGMLVLGAGSVGLILRRRDVH